MKVLLGDLVNIKTGKLDANQADENGKYPFFTCSKEISKINSYSYDCECVLIAGNGDLNVKYYNGKFEAYQRTYILTSTDVNTLSNKYIYWFMNRYIVQLRNQSIGGVIKYIKLGDLTNISLNLPTLDVQKRIVGIFESIDRLIDTKVFILQGLDDLIKSRFVELFGDPVLNEKGWNLTSLESVCQSIYGGGTPSKKIKEYYMGTIPWVTSKDMKSDIIVDSIEHITQVAIDNSSTKIIPPESVLIVIRSGILKHTLPVCINKSRVTINQDLKALVLDERCKAIYLQYLLKALEKDILSGVRAVTADNIEFNSLKKRKIPIPPINKQIKFSQMVNQINKLKSDVQKSIDETRLLMDSLMQEYFG